MKVSQIALAEIKPYWRNPRNNERAVDAVKQSIEKYGFNSPLVLDTDNVIIAGHTRYKALIQLGWKKAPCVVVDLPADKAKEFRIADNKTSELATWDMDNLIPELREIGDLDDLQIYFQNVDLDNLLEISATVKLPTGDDIAAKELQQNTQFTEASSNAQGNYVEVFCPDCAHAFYVDKLEINRQPGVDEI